MKEMDFTLIKMVIPHKANASYYVLFDYFDIGKYSFLGIAHFISLSYLCTRK